MIGTGDEHEQVPFARLRVSEQGRITQRNRCATAWFGDVHSWADDIRWSGETPDWTLPGLTRAECVDRSRDLILHPVANDSSVDMWLVDGSAPLAGLRATMAPFRLQVTRALVPSLAHEINNAVHLVFGLCDEVRMRLADVEVVQLADQAEHHGRHVATLLDTLRTIATEDCGSAAALALGGIAERVVALCRKGGDGRGVSLALLPGPHDEIRVRVPETDLATVMAMLTLHVIETVPDESRVELSLVDVGVEWSAAGDDGCDRGLAAVARQHALGFAAAGIDGFRGDAGAFAPAWLALATHGARLEVERADGRRLVRLRFPDGR